MLYLCGSDCLASTLTFGRYNKIASALFLRVKYSTWPLRILSPSLLSVIPIYNNIFFCQSWPMEESHHWAQQCWCHAHSVQFITRWLKGFFFQNIKDVTPLCSGLCSSYTRNRVYYICPSLCNVSCFLCVYVFVYVCLVFIMLIFFGFGVWLNPWFGVCH